MIAEPMSTRGDLVAEFGSPQLSKVPYLDRLLPRRPGSDIHVFDPQQDGNGSHLPGPDDGDVIKGLTTGRFKPTGFVQNFDTTRMKLANRMPIETLTSDLELPPPPPRTIMPWPTERMDGELLVRRRAVNEATDNIAARLET